jgi:hypothetical protein
MGLSLTIFSFHAPVCYSFRHIPVLLGLVILWIDDHFLRIVFFLVVLIAWKIKKQTAACRSGAKVDLRVMALLTTQVTWLRCLLEDFGVSVTTPTPLLSRSTSVISIACGLAKHEFTKHIGDDASFMRSHVQDQVIALRYAPSEPQLAYSFMKAQTRAQHSFYLSKLGGVAPP